MMNQWRDQIKKKVDKFKFVTDILLNASLVFIVYTVINSFFAPNAEPESENFGAVFAQRSLENKESDIKSPLYIRTDKMDLVIDRANGSVAQVILRDQDFHVVPYSAENKMMLDAEFLIQI